MSDAIAPQKNKSVPADKDGLLWHFTTLDALPKILLQDDGLLAGHTSFMSDPNDCVISNRFREVMLELFCVAIHHLIPNAIITDSTKKLVARQLGIGADIPTFITCLSTSLNNPKRWKESTRHGGVAIGFNASKLHGDLKTDPLVAIAPSDYALYKVFPNSWRI